MEFDDVLQKVGPFGWYQKRLCLLLCLVGIPAAFHNLGYVFWAARPDHWCRPPDSPALANLSHEELMELTVPWEDRLDGVRSRSQCSSYDHDFRNMTSQELRNEIAQRGNRTYLTRTCREWDYDTSQYRSSIVTEWDLVCDHKWLTSTTQSVYMVGRLVGTMVWGYLADKIGRRRTLLITTVSTIVFSIACALVTNFYGFLLTRCLVALSATGEFQTAFVIVVEIVGPKWRPVTGTLIMLFWALGYIILGGLAYAFRDKLSLMLATSVPLVALISYYWLIPESPRWQLTQGRVKEALDLLRHMATVNKRDLSENIDIVLPKVQKTQASHADLLRTKHIRRTSLLLFYIWFVNSIVYYGLSLNSSNLGGNDYLNFFIAGGVEIPAYLMGLLALWYCGRRWTLATLMAVSGLSLLTTIAFLMGPDAARITLAMVGKFAITCSYSLVYIYTAEIYPTSFRSIGVGTCSFISRIGGVIAPYAAEVDQLYKGMPLIIFGALSLLAALLMYFLPETRGLPLPQTVEDAEKNAKTQNKCSFCCSAPKNEEGDIGISTIYKPRNGCVNAAESVPLKPPVMNGSMVDYQRHSEKDEVNDHLVTKEV